jgi:hypothetical protein
MLNYRIRISKDSDDTTQDWDLFDRVIILWGIGWIAKSAKEVALAYAKSK